MTLSRLGFRIFLAESTLITTTPFPLHLSMFFTSRLKMHARCHNQQKIGAEGWREAVCVCVCVWVGGGGEF